MILLFDYKRPKSPKEIGQLQHNLNIIFHSLVVARIERACFVYFFTCNFFINLKTRIFIIRVFEAALIKEVGDVVGSIVEAGIFKIDEQYVWFSVYLFYENIVIVCIIMAQSHGMLAPSKLFFGLLFKLIELFH